MSRLAVVTIVSSLDAKCPSALIIECRERGITPPGYPGAIAAGGADGLLPPGIDHPGRWRRVLAGRLAVGVSDHGDEEIVL